MPVFLPVYENRRTSAQLLSPEGHMMRWRTAVQTLDDRNAYALFAGLKAPVQFMTTRIDGVRLGDAEFKAFRSRLLAKWDFAASKEEAEAAIAALAPFVPGEPRRDAVELPEPVSTGYVGSGLPPRDTVKTHVRRKTKATKPA